MCEAENIRCLNGIIFKITAVYQDSYNINIDFIGQRILRYMD